MNQQPQLKNAVLMMALAAAYPMHSYAAAGIAQFSSGDVTLRRGAAADPLTKGKDIESGDAIVTGSTGRAQVRFSDGGLVSLAPNSQFNISNYADKGDPKQDSFFVDLLRGGMRAVTGLIGKRNRENFKVTTTTATIGIRGSAFNIAYNADGTLSVSTELDAIEVCTRAGCVGLTAGESALVVSQQEAPIRSSIRATLPTPEPRQDPEIAGNQQGIVPTVTPPAPAPEPPPRILTGMAFAGSGLMARAVQVLTELPQSDGDYTFNPNYYDQRHYMNGTLVLDENGKAVQYVSSTNANGESTSDHATLVHSSGSFKTGDLLVLGTWDEAIWTEGESSRTVMHQAFASGQPTPQSGLTSLTGQRGTYMLTAATPVYSSLSEPGTLLPTSKVVVDFLGAGNYVDVSLDISMPKPPVSESLANAVSTTNEYNLRGSGTGTGAGFAGALSVSSPACLAGDYSFCGKGAFNGFVTGDQAQKLGLSYSANTGDNGYISGAGEFTRGSTTVTPQNQLVTSGLVAGFVDGSGDYYLNNWLGRNYTGMDEFTFNGDQLVKFKRYGSTPGTTLELTGSVSTFGAIGKLSDSDFIGWGSWASTTQTDRTYSYYSYTYTTNSKMVDALHYIVAKPTMEMPLSGSASYTMIGGTAPTMTTEMGTQTGQLLSSSLSVNFSSGSVYFYATTQFGSDLYNLNSPASISGARFSGSSSCGSCCDTNIKGVFSGTLANRAGVVYSRDEYGVGRIAGAVALQRTWSNALSTNPSNPYSSY